MIDSVCDHVVLEKCVKDILTLIKPAEDDRNKRLSAILELENCMHSVAALRGVAVKPFGSFVSDLYSKSGDLDLSVQVLNGSNLPINKKKKQNVLREVRRALLIKGVAGYMQFIPRARVPVLQYVSNLFGISCDISIDNYAGRIKSKILYWVNTLDERFGDMVLLIKEWAKAQNINDPKTGSLNSYSLCLLVLFHFQTSEPPILPPLKEIYEGNIAEDITEGASYNEGQLDEVCAANIAKFQLQNKGQRNESSLCRLLATFFHKFIYIDALPDAVISTYTGQFERTQDNPSRMMKSYHLFVEDPVERSDNAARAISMRGLHRIASAFNDANHKFESPEHIDRNELLALLCTPGVVSKLGGRVIARSYTNTPQRSHQQTRSVGRVDRDQRLHEARVLTGSRSVHKSPQADTTVHQTAVQHQSRSVHKSPQADTTVHQTAVQHQNRNCPQDFSMIERVLKVCIEDILSEIKPVENDRKKRLWAIQELADSIYSVGALRGAAVNPFGSFLSNLYAKYGDLDLSIDLWSGSNIPISKRKKQNVLRQLMKALQIRGVARSMQFIPNARVPVLQYMSNHFGISCDISIDNYPGRIKSGILYWIHTIDDRFGDLVLLVKEWAKSQNINDKKNGTLNSYSLCLLVLFHFQTCKPAIIPPLKDIYDRNVAEMVFCDEKHVDEVCARNIARFQGQNMGQINRSSLSHLLVSFFHKFCRIGDLSSEVVSTYTGRLERIEDNPSWMAKSYSLFIEDPFERPDNAARAVGEEELQRIGYAFNDVSYRFTNDALCDRNELLSLLCTPAVGYILGDGVRADRYTNTPPSQHHRPARGFTGSRSVRTSQGSTTGRQTAGPYHAERVTAGQYQNSNRSQVYTTELETAVPYRYDNHPRLHTAGRQTAGRYQNQQRKSEYVPYRQHADTTRYEPDGGRRFHDGPTWYSGSQASGNTAWQR